MKVGDKVVCIDDLFQISCPPKRLVKGEIYTIIEVFEFFNGSKALQLKEIGFVETPTTYGYRIERFRKIEPKFTNELTKALANGHEERIEFNPKELEKEKV